MSGTGTVDAPEALVGYFGYGSLVNRATHRTDVVTAHPARLRGWRRCWRPRPAMPGVPAALLTIRPDPDCHVDGLLVIDRLENLAAVDAREARYDRVALGGVDLECFGAPIGEVPLYVYVAQAHLPPHPRPPIILRSYLDAVMQGFLREHGEPGLRQMVAETEGFDVPVHEDRHAPVYPRFVEIDARERELFDALVPAAAPAGFDFRAEPG